MIRLLLIFALSSPLVYATDINVGIGVAHDLTKVELSANPSAAIKRCSNCTSAALTKTVELSIRTGKVAFDGQQVEKLYVTGHWQLKFADGAVGTGVSQLAISSSRGMLHIVARIPLEDYVAQVLDAEAGGFKSPEARRAMAIAVRTFAVAFRARHQAEGFDLCDSTHCQAMIVGEPSKASKEAAESTEGELLWYHGTLARTYYHRSCGGTLEDGKALDGKSTQYLLSKTDTYCLRDPQSWRSTLKHDQVLGALSSAGIHLPAETKFTVAARTASGRAESISASINGSVQSISAGKFHLAIARVLGWNTIQSDLYELRDDGTNITLTGKGRGHGVGLCQAGSEQMGQAGKNYREILAFYYPGTRIGLTAAGIEWQPFHGQRIDLQTTDTRDQRLITIAEDQLRYLEAALHRRLDQRVTLRVFPSVEMFRNATGAPGWREAETRGTVIRMQPMVAKPDHAIKGILRHEIVHLFLRGASASVPRWFQEGVASVLAEEGPRVGSALKVTRLQSLDSDFYSTDLKKQRAAYGDAAKIVRQCMKTAGRDTVLNWVYSGFPKDLSTTCGIGR